jgi:hypothetical protein
MKRIIFPGLILNFLLLLTGCATKCPDFDRSVLEWMPYKLGDKLILYNQNQADTFVAWYSQIDHSDKIVSGMDCACDNSYFLKLHSDSVDLLITFYNSSNIKISEIDINEDALRYSQQMDSIDLDKQSFKDVIVFKNPNINHPQRFDSVFVSKSIGIIAVYTANELWSIRDNSKRGIKISDVKMLVNNCGF